MTTCLECECNWNKVENDRLNEMRRLLEKSEQYRDQTDGRGYITGLDHALRTAGIAAAEGSYFDMAFVGLVHDLGRPLNDVHHGELIAEMVRDRVTEDSYMVLKTHGQFQSAIVHKYPEGLPYKEEPWFDYAAQLAGFEKRSFAAEYDGPVMTLEEADALLVRYLG